MEKRAAISFILLFSTIVTYDEYVYTKIKDENGERVVKQTDLFLKDGCFTYSNGTVTCVTYEREDNNETSSDSVSVASL